MCKVKLFIIFLITTITFSCDTNIEEPILIEPEQVSEVEIIKTIYLLDGKEVHENPLDLDDDNIYIGITGDLDETDSQKGIVTIYSFSSKERYIEWGYDNNFPVALNLEISDHLSAYAIENGVIEEHERTGVVPQSYLEYEKQYYDRMTSSSINQPTSRLPKMLHKDCVQGASAPLPGTLPVMWPGWNNKTSAYFHFTIWGNFTIFDRSFYRKRIASLWRWGWQRTCFTGPLGSLNDRMSSGF